MVVGLRASMVASPGFYNASNLRSGLLHASDAISERNTREAHQSPVRLSDQLRSADLRRRVEPARHPRPDVHRPTDLHRLPWRRGGDRNERPGGSAQAAAGPGPNPATGEGARRDVWIDREGTRSPARHARTRLVER